MKTTVFAIVSALLLACGGSKTAPPPAKPGSGETHAEMGGGGMCPMMGEGTKITATDTQTGVEVSFTTTGDVAKLREHVRHMAEMHEHHMGPGAGSGSGDTHEMKMVPSSAKAEDIDGGAKIVLTPTDPSQLAALRAHVHEHAQMMASGHCPMMEKGGMDHGGMDHGGMDHSGMDHSHGG